MGRIAIPATVDCPHCREKNPAAEDRCLACGKALTVYIGPAHAIPRRFGLGSLMALVAVVAPGLAVFREERALGTFMLLIMVPALVRTLAIVATRKADGRPLAAIERVGTFGASMGIVWLIGMAAALAHGAVAFTTSLAMEVAAMLFASLAVLNPGAPIFLGSLAALATAYAVGRSLWVPAN